MVRYSIIITRTIQAIIATEGSELVSRFFPAVGLDNNKGDHGVVTMTNGIETPIYQEIMIPEGIVTVDTAYAIVIPEGSGNLDWEVTTDWFGVAANEAYNAGTDSASGTTAVLTGEGEAINITAAFTGATALDVVGILFKRITAADTVGADVLYVGVYVSGS